MWRWLTLLLFLVAGLARAQPTWAPAPEVLEEAPIVAAPPGGWWTEDGVYAAVHGDAADRATVRRLADRAAVSVPRLAAQLGVPAGTQIDIYVAAPGAFHAIQPGTAPDWADGTAWPRSGLIFLHSPRDRSGVAESLDTVLDHELVHILLGRAFAPRVPPRWLQEGMAQYYAGELGPPTAETLSSAHLAGGLLPLATVVNGFPADAGLARIAYAQSADLIGWIGTEYGRGALTALVAEMQAGAPAPQAILRVTGKDLDTLEKAWGARWSDPLLWGKAILSSGLLWGVLSVLLVFGGWRRWRRGKQKLARWEAEEQRLRRQRELALIARLELDGYRAPGPEPRQVLEFRGPEQ